MKSIVATCPTCGEVTLSAGELSLIVYHNATARSHYRFRCVSCQAEVRKVADERVIELLRMAGVRAEETAVPAEIFERDPTRTPITVDDLLDFIILLAVVKTPVTHCLPTSNVHTGPPLSAEDLLDLFLLLTATDNLAEEAAERLSPSRR